MRMIGKRPADHNPNWCSECFDFITEHHGGAEVELSLLFADIRGSTAMAEGMSPSAYRAILDRLYDVAAQAPAGPRRPHDRPGRARPRQPRPGRDDRDVDVHLLARSCRRGMSPLSVSRALVDYTVRSGN
jgi:hypothetical protein